MLVLAELSAVRWSRERGIGGVPLSLLITARGVEGSFGSFTSIVLTLPFR